MPCPDDIHCAIPSSIILVQQRSVRSVAVSHRHPQDRGVYTERSERADAAVARGTNGVEAKPVEAEPEPVEAEPAEAEPAETVSETETGETAEPAAEA